MNRDDLPIAAAVLILAALIALLAVSAAALALHVVHRAAPAAVVRVTIDRPAGPTDLEWLLLQPVLSADELTVADNP